MFVHELKGPGMCSDVPVLSQAIRQCEPFGGDRHQKTNQIFFVSGQEVL